MTHTTSIPVNLRIDLADLQLIRERAESAGMKYQTWLRQLIRAGLDAGFTSTPRQPHADVVPSIDVDERLRALIDETVAHAVARHSLVSQSQQLVSQQFQSQNPGLAKMALGAQLLQQGNQFQQTGSLQEAEAMSQRELSQGEDIYAGLDLGTIDPTDK